MSVFITETAEAEAFTPGSATTPHLRKEIQLPTNTHMRGNLEVLHTLASANLSRSPQYPQHEGKRPRRLRKGLTVAIIGPDGAGKSTLARSLGASKAFPAEIVYMGGNPESSMHALPTTRLLVRYGKWKGQENRSTASAAQAPATASSKVAFAARETIKFFNELLEYSYRFMIAWAARRRRSVVIFDRYVYDAWIDAMADGASPWRWLRATLLRRLFPRPDVLLVLEASPDLLFARKGEHSPERLARVQTACRRVAGDFKRVGYIDASQPPEQVLQEAIRHIGRYLGLRSVRKR